MARPPTGPEPSDPPAKLCSTVSAPLVASTSNKTSSSWAPPDSETPYCSPVKPEAITRPAKGVAPSEQCEMGQKLYTLLKIGTLVSSVVIQNTVS
jgi:hypothetical protein